MGIMGSLRVSNFSLFCVTGFAFVLSGWTIQPPRYTLLKNITRSKRICHLFAVGTLESFQNQQVYKANTKV
jgi:hypothetical protein